MGGPSVEAEIMDEQINSLVHSFVGSRLGVFCILMKVYYIVEKLCRQSEN